MPSLPLVGPRPLAEILREDFAGREASNEEGSHVPVKGGDDIVALKCRGIADGDGLHAVAGIDAPDDSTLPVEGGDAVLQSSVSRR